MSVPKSKRTMSSVEFMEQAIQLRKHLTLYILSDFGVGGRKLNLTLYVQNQTCLTEEEKAAVFNIIDKCESIAKVKHFIFLKTHFYLSESGAITTTPVKSTLQRHRAKIKRLKRKLTPEENALNYKSWKCSLRKCFTNTYHAIREADRQFARLFGTKAEVKQ